VQQAAFMEQPQFRCQGGLEQSDKQ